MADTAHGGERGPLACSGCLTELVPCGCGAMVTAGDGHPDCPKSVWFGFWMCDCGHCTRHHNQWWDTGDDGGGGCDRCSCADAQVPDPSGRTGDTDDR